MNELSNISLTIDGDWKRCRSENFNYDFNLKTGYTETYGKTVNDDPVRFPSFVIADIEVTTSCKGPKVNIGDKTINRICSFCYKSNNPNGQNMSLETFKSIVEKFPYVIDPNTGKRIYFCQQIAIGGDADCSSNPYIWDIMEYCREVGIIPNITVANLNDETAQKISKYCGATAVSRYSDKNVCYDTVDLLSNKYGMLQINIHQILTKESLNNVWETLKDIKSDPRLKKLNAIVFLSLKKKGRGITQESISQEEFSAISQYCLKNNISFGFDSCSAGKLLKSLNKEQFDKISPCVDSCCAGNISFYCDVEGKYFPCSFMANEEGDWKDGIDILKVNDFLKEVWNHPKTIEFGKRAIECNNRFGGCCHFKV